MPGWYNRNGGTGEPLAGFGDQDGDLTGISRHPGAEVGRDPGAVKPQHLGLMVGEAAQILGFADPPQHYALGQDRLGGHLLRKAKQHRRRPLRHKTCRDQALGKIRGQVVSPKLPLDALATGPEVVPLAHDQAVELSAGYADVTRRPDPSHVPTDDPQDRTVVLVGHAGRDGAGRHTHLRVVSGQQSGGINHDHTVPDERYRGRQTLLTRQAFGQFR